MMNNNPCYTIQFSDLIQLKKCYMPFIKGGGIFVVTKNEHSLNEKIDLKISLPEKSEIFNVCGKVVWINPALAQFEREQGVGVNLEGGEAEVLKANIEKLLDRVSDTIVKTATL